MTEFLPTSPAPRHRSSNRQPTREEVEQSGLDGIRKEAVLSIMAGMTIESFAVSSHISTREAETYRQDAVRSILAIRREKASSVKKNKELDIADVAMVHQQHRLATGAPTNNIFDRSLCLDVEDPDIFFPVGDTDATAKLQIEQAKKVCAKCLITTECLERALNQKNDFGIWGGMTEGERKVLRKPKPKKRPA